jgi:hypothetical protein
LIKEDRMNDVLRDHLFSAHQLGLVAFGWPAEPLSAPTTSIVAFAVTSSAVSLL